MSPIRFIILFSMLSALCVAQTETSNTGVEPLQSGPVLTTPNVTLTPHGPVFGNPVAEAQQAAVENANTANAGAAQSSDFLIQGADAPSNRSLGEVAREYRAQQGQQGHASKTFNEDDLKNLRTPGDNQTTDSPTVLTPQSALPAPSDNTGGNAALLPQSDQAADTIPTGKPSANHRSVVQEVQQQVNEMQQAR